MACSCLLRSSRAFAFSSGVSLRLGSGAAVRPRPLVVEPVTVRYLLASAALRLGVGRPLPASAAGLLLAGASGVCVPWGPWAWPSVAPPLLRRNTGVAYCVVCGGTTPGSLPFLFLLRGDDPPAPPDHGRASPLRSLPTGRRRKKRGAPRAVAEVKDLWLLWQAAQRPRCPV